MVNQEDGEETGLIQIGIGEDQVKVGNITDQIEDIEEDMDTEKDQDINVDMKEEDQEDTKEEVQKDMREEDQEDMKEEDQKEMKEDVEVDQDMVEEKISPKRLKK